MHSFMPTSSPIVCLNNFNQVSHHNTEEKQPSSKPRMTSFSLLNLATSTFSSSLTLQQLSTPLTTPFSSPIWNRPSTSLALPSPGSVHISLKDKFIGFNNCLSSTAPFAQGILQGSVVGPFLFIIYPLTLHSITQYKHGVPFHCYVDHIQIYMSTESFSLTTYSTLTNCLVKIKSLMQTIFLQLNYDKSDLKIIGPKSHTKTTQNFCSTINKSTLSPSPNIRKLFDIDLSFQDYVNHIAKNIFFT